LLTIEPGLTISGFRNRYPGSTSEHTNLFCEGLAKSGVPK